MVYRKSRFRGRSCIGGGVFFISGKRREKMKKIPIAVYVLIFVIIFAIALGVMAFMVMGRVNTITKEAEKIASMDITEDELDTTIYSTGRYAVVESTMKSYVKTYIQNISTLKNLKSDSTLQSMLGVANIMTDGPDFATSRAYIEKLRTKISNAESALKQQSKEENIISTFNEKGLNFFFNWIYKKEMIDTIGLNFYYSDEDVSSAASQLNEMLDKRVEVLDFLTTHKNEWKCENNMLQFDTDELLNEYQTLIENV